MENPLITIIVPVYNVENYIEKCILSILNQTYSNIEILLVNDGSTDSSAEICEKYKTIDKRIKVYHLKNGGVSKARNFAISKVTGKYIMFVDSDDWINENMCELLYTMLEENECDLSVCEFNSAMLGNANEIKSIILSKDEMFNEILNSNGFGGYVCNKLFKTKIIREIIKEKKGFREDIFYCEDMLFVSEYILKSTKGYYTTEKLYNYVVRQGSSTTTLKFDDKILTLISAYEELIKIYCKINSSKIDQVIFNYIKINLNIKYRILSSNLDKNDDLEMINKNIKKYLTRVFLSSNITFAKKCNVLLSYVFPSGIGRIKEQIKIRKIIKKEE